LREHGPPSAIPWPRSRRKRWTRLEPALQALENYVRRPGSPLASFFPYLVTNLLGGL
jgi:hypothetical protein